MMMMMLVDGSCGELITGNDIVVSLDGTLL